MVWKLCDKEERPKFKRFIKLLFVLCAPGLMRWNTTKNSAWISARASTGLSGGLCPVTWTDSGRWPSAHLGDAIRRFHNLTVVTCCLLEEESRGGQCGGHPPPHTPHPTPHIG